MFRTVQRYVSDVKGTCKSTTRSKPAFTKRGHNELAPKDSEVTSDTASLCRPANESLGGPPTVESISAPQKECVGSRSQLGPIINTAVSSSPPSPTSASSSSSSTRRPPKSKSPLAPEPGRSSIPSGSQQTFTCPSSTGNNDCHWLPNPTSPAIKLPMQNHDNGIIDSHEEVFAGSYQAGNAHINRTTTVQPAGPRHPSQFHGHVSSREEACNALRVMIRFCEQQPTEFLEFQEIVLLGKLKEKLRHIGG